MGEHSGRYNEMAQFFSHWGFDVLAPDFPGHGLTASEGAWPELQGVRRWTEIIDEVLQYWFINGPRNSGAVRAAPYFTFGHSYGGLALLNWACTLRDKTRVLDAPKRICSSAPSLKIKIAVPAHKKWTAQVANSFLPYLKIPSGIRSEEISTDPVVQYRYDRDPLNHPYASPEMFIQMLEVADEIKKRPRDVEIPTLLVAGELDSIADPEGVRSFYENLGTQKKLLLFKKSRHEVHNDCERREMFEELLQWMI
jgi:acylglycerol lipase